MCAVAHTRLFCRTPHPSLPLKGGGDFFLCVSTSDLHIPLLKNFRFRCACNFFWRSLHGRAASSVACRCAKRARGRDFTGCRASFSLGGLRGHSATCRRTCERTLPNGSAHPPGPWRSGVAVLDAGARTTPRNKQGQRESAVDGDPPPGGSDGDDTAQPCSDPDLPAGRPYAGRAVMTRPS